MRIIINSNLEDLKARLQMAIDELPDMMRQAFQEAGQTIVDDLKDAAPSGKGESPPPEGDAPGPLAESFYLREEPPPGVPGAAVSIRTTQPTKLKFVRFGTGLYGPRGERIVPKTKKALYWPDAAHPVKSVRGMEPNDFVKPILDNAPNAEEVLGWVVGDIIVMLEG